MLRGCASAIRTQPLRCRATHTTDHSLTGSSSRPRMVMMTLMAATTKREITRLIRQGCPNNKNRDIIHSCNYIRNDTSTFSSLGLQQGHSCSIKDHDFGMGARPSAQLQEQGTCYCNWPSSGSSMRHAGVWQHGHQGEQQQQQLQDTNQRRWWLTSTIPTRHQVWRRRSEVLTRKCRDRKSTRLNSSHPNPSRMPSSA